MIQIFTPSEAYQFQDIVCELFNCLNQALDFQVYGRNGQGQDGIDVVSWKHQKVIQCALKDSNKPDKKNIKDLKEKLKQDLESCLKANTGKIAHFYLASTFHDDKHLQDYAAELSHQHSLDVQYWGWGTICKEILRYQESFQIRYLYLFAKNNPDIVLETDKKYSLVPNYIPRTIRKTSLLGKDNSTTLHDLISLEDARILLLANPGMGKSIELQYFAHIESSQEPLQLLPIFCSLNRYKGNLIQLLDSENIKWKQPESSYLLLLLDAMDELQEQHRDSFVVDIEQFCRLRPKAKIIITCRNNFRRNIKDFETYELDPFSQEDVARFLISWDKQYQDNFWQQARDNKIADLLLIPFYLYALKEIFEKNNFQHLPQGKAKILNELFTSRLNQDKLTRGIQGDELNSRSLELKNSIQRIAISAECLGRNFLDEDEFQEIEIQYDIRKLLKHSFLFNKSNDDRYKWQFEHNNFQEYLAAQELAKQPIETIKKYVSFEPNYDFFKPTWANTINLLISILDPQHHSIKFDALVDWLTVIQPDLFVTSEYYKLEILTRQNIFKKIFKDAKLKGIWIERKYSSLEELALFSGGGIEIGTFLLNEIRESENHQCLVQAILLLGFTENIEELFPDIADLLKTTIQNTDNKKLGRVVKGYAIETASRLRIRLDKLTLDYLDKIGFNISSSIRSSVYKYIQFHNESEMQISILIDGMHKLSHSGILQPGSHGFDDEESDPHNMSEESNLSKCIDEIRSEPNLVLILDTFRKNNHSFMEHIVKEIWPTILRNCVSIYRFESGILPQIMELTIAAYRNTHESIYLEEFELFVKQTKSENEVFNYCIEKSKEDWYYCFDVFKVICNDKHLDRIISLYKSNALTESQIFFGRAVLRDKNDALHDAFQTLLLVEQGEKFKYQEQVDFDQKQREGEKRDLDLLLSKKKFFNELSTIFNEFDKETVSKKYILDSYRPQYYYHFGIIKRTLLDLADNFDISKKDIIDYQKKVVWKQFVIHHLYQKKRNNISHTTDKRQEQWITNWCKEAIKKIDFKTSFFYETENTYRYSPNCTYLVFFYSEMELNLGEKKELEMLWYDWFAPRLKVNNNHYQEERGSKLVAKLLEKHGKEKVKEALLRHLDEGIENQTIYMSHWRICEELDIKEAASFLPDYFLKSTDTWQKHTLLEIFEKLNGHYKRLEPFISNPPLEGLWEWTLLEFLCKCGSKKAEIKLLEIIQEEPSIKDTNPLHASSILVKNRHAEGLQYLVRWTKIFKQCIPKHTLHSHELVQLGKDKSVPLLLEYYNITNGQDYRERAFDNQAREVSEALLEIAKSSDKYFNQIQSHFEQLIAINKPEVHKNPIGLHNMVRELRTRYYSNKSSKIELQEVLQLNRLLV
jgi:hypothetical protein